MVILNSFKKKIFLVKSGQWQCVVNAADVSEACAKAFEQVMACYAQAGLEQADFAFLTSCQEIIEDLEQASYVSTSAVLADNGHYELARQFDVSNLPEE